MGLVILNIKTKNNRLERRQKRLIKYLVELKEFKSNTRKLLWCIAKQKEKVPSILDVVISNMNSGFQYNEEEVYQIKQDIMRNIKW